MKWFRLTAAPTPPLCWKKAISTCLLTDIVMPEMDGIELARHCARVSPKTEVMFITGFSGVALRAGQSMPQAKVLSKPFHLKDLVLEVERLFNKEAASGQL